MSRWANRPAPPPRPVVLSVRQVRALQSLGLAPTAEQIGRLQRMGLVPPVRIAGASTDIGINWWQSRGSARDEIDVLNVEMHAFDNELTSKVQNAPGYPHQPPTDLETFLAAAWTPIMAGWVAWYKANRTTIFGYWNFDDVAKAYYAQLAQARAKAAQLGLSVDSPAPAPPEAPTLRGGLDNLERDLGGLAWTIAKVAIVAGITVIALPWAVGRVYDASERAAREREEDSDQ